MQVTIITLSGNFVDSITNGPTLTKWRSMEYILIKHFNMPLYCKYLTTDAIYTGVSMVDNIEVSVVKY